MTIGQRVCFWNGPLFLVLFGLGFVVCMQFVPPMTPAMSAEEVAALFRDRTAMIRLGITLMLFGAGTMLPWVSLISTQMRRIEGCGTELIWTQLIAGAVGAVLILGVAMLWALASFRPERDPALTQLINDFAWLLLITPVAPAIVQPAVIGVAILSDRSSQPVFPRWAGYLNLWVACLFAPGCLALFFKSGPFAWSGIFPFWIPVGCFGGWWVVMCVLVHRSLRNPGRAPFPSAQAVAS